MDMRSIVYGLVCITLCIIVGSIAYQRGAHDTRVELEPRLQVTEDALKQSYYRALADACNVWGLVSRQDCNTGIGIAAASGRWYEQPSPGFVWPPALPPKELPAGKTD